MPLIVDVTVGGSASNSYITVAEAIAYMESRLSIPEWDSADSQEALVVMATRVLDAQLDGHTTLVREPSGNYQITSPSWTGLPATTTQRLAWPRTGMLDRNGNAIASTVLPIDLKNATAELAGQLARGDRTLDNDALIYGLTSIRAGSVAMTFKEEGLLPQVLPDAVWNLLVDSWYTDETMEPAIHAEFEVL